VLFWLKKVVSFWLMPLPLSLALGAAGFVCWRYTRRRRLGRGLIAVAIAILLISTNKFVAESLLRPLETIYPAMPEFAEARPLPRKLAECRHVVVLGGGNHRTPDVAASNLLSTASLARLVEGIRILRVLPAAKLIITGSGEPGEITNAVMQGRAAISLGVAPERILYVELVRDTEDESRAVARLAGEGPVALVTSAWHMRRAAALFRGAGLKTVPCPADFTTKDNPGWKVDDFLWEVGAIYGTSRALREHLGYLWIRLRGVISSPRDGV